MPSAGGARLGKPLNFLLTFLRGRSRAKTTATFPPFLCLVKSGKVVVNGLPTSFLRSPPQFFQARWAAAEKVRGRNKGVFFFPDFLLLRRIQQVIRDDQKEDSLSSPPPIFLYYCFCLFHLFLPLSPDSHSRHLTWGIKRREKRRSYMISCRLHYHFNREGRTTIIALKQSQYPRLTSRTFDTFTPKQIFSDLLAISKREREIPHSILLFFVPVSLFLACDHNFMHYIFSRSSKRGKKCLFARALPCRAEATDRRATANQKTTFFSSRSPSPPPPRLSERMRR